MLMNSAKVSLVFSERSRLLPGMAVWLSLNKERECVVKGRHLGSLKRGDTGAWVRSRSARGGGSLSLLALAFFASLSRLCVPRCLPAGLPASFFWRALRRFLFSKSFTSVGTPGCTVGLVGWLVGCLVGCLVGWLVGELVVGWFFGCTIFGCRVGI